MKSIICKIQLGLGLQQLFIKKDGDKIESVKMPIKDIAKFIVNQEQDVEMFFSGSKDFFLKIKQQTEELEIAKYGIKKAKFHYI